MPNVKDITIPATIHGERVVCAFPVIGEGGFVEAEVVTFDGHTTFSVARYVDGRDPFIIVGSETNSFPEAIRHARSNTGWG